MEKTAKESHERGDGIPFSLDNFCRGVSRVERRPKTQKNWRRETRIPFRLLRLRFSKLIECEGNAEFVRQLGHFIVRTAHALAPLLQRPGKLLIWRASNRAEVCDKARQWLGWLETVISASFSKI